MTKPVRKIDPNDILATLLKGQPGMDWDLEKALPNGERVSMPYRMQLLSTEDSLQALKDAQATAKERGEVEGYGDIYKESQAHELLIRAMRHRDLRELSDGTSYYPPIFVEAWQLRKALTELEMAALLNAYEITKSTFAVVEGLEAHDAESWIARLSDPLRGPFALAALDSLHWRPCILMLAQVARRLLEESGQKLPSLDSSSESDPDSSTSSTGSSGPPPSASSTGPDAVQVPGDRLISKDEAAAILKQRKGQE
jgi:hypothetical protein